MQETEEDRTEKELNRRIRWLLSQEFDDVLALALLRKVLLFRRRALVVACRALELESGKHLINALRQELIGEIERATGLQAPSYNPVQGEELAHD